MPDWQGCAPIALAWEIFGLGSNYKGLLAVAWPRKLDSFAVMNAMLELILSRHLDESLSVMVMNARACWSEHVLCEGAVAHDASESIILQACGSTSELEFHELMQENASNATDDDDNIEV